MKDRISPLPGATESLSEAGKRLDKMAEEALPDVQSEKVSSGVQLQWTGVRGVKIPVWILDQSNSKQRIIADFNIGTHLEKDNRGVHMSRFLEQLEPVYEEQISLDYLQNILLPSIVMAQGTWHGKLEMSFDYFMGVRAPVSGLRSKLPLRCKFKVETNWKPELTVRTPVMLVCPCSLEMSDLNQAHNQRGYVEITIRAMKFVWIEDLAKIAMDAASSPVYPLLKRADELWVTDNSHQRPRFVEDACREVVLELHKMSDAIESFVVTVESQESIHAHNAFAKTEEFTISILEGLTDGEKEETK